jgi:hypothetical protein
MKDISTISVEKTTKDKISIIKINTKAKNLNEVIKVLIKSYSLSKKQQSMGGLRD